MHGLTGQIYHLSKVTALCIFLINMACRLSNPYLDGLGRGYAHIVQAQSRALVAQSSQGGELDIAAEFLLLQLFSRWAHGLSYKHTNTLIHKHVDVASENPT